MLLLYLKQAAVCITEYVKYINVSGFALNWKTGTCEAAGIY